MCENCKLKGMDSFAISRPCGEGISIYQVFLLISRRNQTVLRKRSGQRNFLVCSGKVKLSVSSKGGKTLILQIARPGDILGLSAAMSGIPYEVSAETLHPSQVVFISREDFLPSSTGFRRFTRQSSGS